MRGKILLVYFFFFLLIPFSIFSLLKKGINLEVAAKKSGFTPLVVACLKGNLEGIKVCCFFFVFFSVFTYFNSY